jgi:hypothetical protein
MTAAAQPERTVSAPRVDWAQLIVDLVLAGYSHERIAAECMRGKTWVWTLANEPGSEPRFHDGQVLLGLWERATGRPEGGPPVR